MKWSKIDYIKISTIGSLTTLEDGSSSHTLNNSPKIINPESSVCINNEILVSDDINE